MTHVAERYGGTIRINITDDVLPIALQETSSEREFQDQVRLLWRAMSGSAHSLLWHHFGQEGTTVKEVNDDGVGELTAGGDVTRLGMDYLSAFRIAIRGWQLLAERSGRADITMGDSDS